MGMQPPRFMIEGYNYFDEKEMKWKLKEDAPDWAKKEFAEFEKMVNSVPDEDGAITQF